MKSKKLLERQVSALRYSNGILRQAVPPEKQKYLPETTAETPKPPTLKDRFKKILPKIAKILAVLVVLGAIAALVAIEVSVLSSKEKEEPVTENIPMVLPASAEISGLNAYFGGCAAEYGDRLYFLSPLQDRLYYFDKAGNLNKITNSSVSNLSAADCYVYYINGKTNVVERMNVHSGDTLAMGIAVCTSAIISEDGIYCIAIEDGALRKYTQNGRAYEEVMPEKIKTADKAGDILYALTESGDLFEIREGESRLIAEQVYLSGMIDGKMYFSDGESLFCLKDGQISDTGYAARDFNGNGDFLLLQDPERETQLILQTEESSLILAADYRGGLTVTENYIVYTSVDGYRYMIRPENGLERSLLP